MEQVTLKCELRKKTGTKESRRLRRSDRVPGIVYGHKMDPIHLTLDRERLEEILATGARMTQLDIGGKREPALIKDVQHDHLGRSVIHVDFARVALDEKVELSVPLETIGTAAGAKHGGVLDLVLKELPIACLATNIPERIGVKVANLEIGGHVCVKDLELPPGVTALADAETVVVVVHQPTAEAPAAEAAPVAEAATEPEVIAKGKEKEKPEEEEEAEA